MREELGGFALPHAIDEATVFAIESAIRAVRPDLELPIQGFGQRLDFDLHAARLCDAYGSRTLRAEDHEAIARAIAGEVQRLVGDVRPIVCVERLYGFDWDAATREQIGELRGRMRAIDGWVEGGDFAAWFSANEDDVPRLGAAMEPPGLHVFGTLEPARWQRWHGELVRVARDTSIPVRADL